MRKNLELLVSGCSGQSSRIPVAWRASTEILDYLKEKKIPMSRAFVTLSIFNEKDREVNRYFAPLKQALEYVDFYESGKHKIRAAVWYTRSQKSDSQISRFVCERLNSISYRHDIFHFTNKEVLSRLAMELDNEVVYLEPLYINKKSVEYDVTGDNGQVSKSVREVDVYDTDTVEVEVAKEFFAKEPPPWRKKWVNYFHESPARDQCHYRRRAIFAFSVQPFLMLAWVVSVILVRAFRGFFALLCGMRGINVVNVFRPFACDLYDVCRWEGNTSIFFHKENMSLRHPAIWFMMPTMMIGLFLAVSFVWLLVVSTHYRPEVRANMSWEVVSPNLHFVLAGALVFGPAIFVVHMLGAGIFWILYGIYSMLAAFFSFAINLLSVPAVFVGNLFAKTFFTEKNEQKEKKLRPFSRTLVWSTSSSVLVPLIYFLYLNFDAHGSIKPLKVAVEKFAAAFWDYVVPTMLAVGLFPIVIFAIYLACVSTLAGWLKAKLASFGGWLAEKWNNWQKARAEKARKAEQDDYQRAADTFAYIDSIGVSQSVGLKTLPKENRTVYLRFQNLKTWVCKPFKKG